MEIIAALARLGLRYAFAEFESARHSALLEREGTIVFVGACEKFPAGHYLIRATRGWMNPWLNFPRMLPVDSGFEPELGGAVAYVIFEEAGVAVDPRRD